MAHFEVAQGQSKGFVYVAVRPPIEDERLTDKIASNASSAPIMSSARAVYYDRTRGGTEGNEFIFDKTDIEDHDASLKFSVAAILRASGHSVSVVVDEPTVDGRPGNIFELLEDQQAGELVMRAPGH